MTIQRNAALGIALILISMLFSGIIIDSANEKWCPPPPTEVMDDRPPGEGESYDNDHPTLISESDEPSQNEVMSPNTRSETLPDGRTVEYEYIENEDGSSLKRYDYGGAFYDAGDFIWEYDTGGNEAISTPGLADLNGDRTLEVVFAGANDKIYALNYNGAEYWSEPYGGDVIAPADEVIFGTLSHTPPPFFSSVTIADVDGSKAPEILCGVQDGVICLNSDGSLNWKKGLTNGYYFSTPTVTDLEGEYTGDKDNLELIAGSDSTDRKAWLEAFHISGGDIFRYEVQAGNTEPAMLLMSPVSQDLDGSFDDNKGPTDGDESWHEIVVGSHDHGLRTYEHSGTQGSGEPAYSPSSWSNLAGHQTYGTAAVGNASMNNNNDPWAHEIIVPSSEGAGTTWGQWTGTLYAYDMNGQPLWQYATGGAPSSIFTSPAVADVQLSKYEVDEEITYEVYFGADNGKIYCLSADTQDPLWTYTMGGRCMSSPAICNIDADDELEVVIGSNDGSVYCFEGDPRDTDAQGEPNPVDDGMEDSGGDSGTYDILWEAQTGGSGMGISSPVVADINGDSMLEVIVGDKGGKVYCIAAGGRSSRYQVDWPMFHYDENKTGFYDPNVAYGVSLTPKIREDNNLPEAMVKYVEPGKSIIYNISIMNTGSAAGAASEDTYTVSFDDIPEGWDAAFVSGYHDMLPDGSVTFTLEVHQFDNFTIDVFAPNDGDIGEFARINITATSSNDPAIADMIQTTTFLLINLDFKVEYIDPTRVSDVTSPYNGEKFAEINPGGTYLATIRIQNLGTINDSYNIGLYGITEGWFVEFIDYGSDVINGLELAAPRFNDTEDEKLLTLSIQTPWDAQEGDYSQITVIATSITSLDMTPDDPYDLIKKEDTATFQAAKIGFISITCKTLQKYIDAGKDVIFFVKVINDGNILVDVDLEESGVIKGWKVEFEDFLPQITENGGWKTVEVKVTAPTNGRAYERLSFSLGATVRGATYVAAQLELMAIVTPVYDFTANVEPQQVATLPGQELYFNVSVRNDGNGENDIKAEVISAPPGWISDIGRMEGNGWFSSRSSYFLDYNEIERFTYWLVIPENERANSYQVLLNITDKSGLSDTFVIDVTVNQVYDIRLETYDGRHLVDVDLVPGDVMTWILMVTNNGNGEDTVTLDFDGTNPFWPGYFISVSNTLDFTTNTEFVDFTSEIDVMQYGVDVNFIQNGTASMVSTLDLILDAGSSAWVTFVIGSPLEIQPWNVPTISIWARSSGEEYDTTNNSVRIDISILRPNFEIEGEIVHPEDIVADDVTDLQVKIKNSGQTDSFDVLVVVKVDDEIVERRTLVSMPVDQWKYFTFEWKAVSGTHEIEIMIDPYDDIIETNEEDNMVTATIKVKNEDAKSLTGLGNSIGLGGILVILLIILLVGVLYLQKGKKRVKKNG